MLSIAVRGHQLISQVETSEAKEMTNPVRFGQDFIGRVANPRDILQYYRKKKQAERSMCASCLLNRDTNAQKPKTTPMPQMKKRKNGKITMKIQLLQL